AGLRPHGVGEGPPRARGRAQARPEERRDPRRHRSRPPGRGHRRRRRDHRMDLRSARHGSVPRRRDRPARLPGDPGHQPACRLDHRVDESQRGPPLRGARPADPLPVMADAADTIAVQRVVDAWMSFPGLVIVLSLMAALGPGVLNLIFALSILGAAGASRVIRGATLSTMQDPYVEAARAIGAGHLRIILRYLLPNVMATIII